jgi:hypothetical protein
VTDSRPTVPKEAAQLLIDTLRRQLQDCAAPEAKLALRSAILFEMMHLSEPVIEEPMPKRADPGPRRRLVLEADTKQIFVCDEYYPADYGRVHLMRESRYGTFNIFDMSLEYAKCAVGINAILHDDTEWPADLTTVDEIENYFKEGIS